jgi:hypothetical protein
LGTWIIPLTIISREAPFPSRSQCSKCISSQSVPPSEIENQYHLLSMFVGIENFKK